ncbi:MAG: extracellular solute-binding protein, partial [Actinobacteria bacterium]|nr:extracellular solute-binding protein [Actinomycetota bacterium]
MTTDQNKVRGADVGYTLNRRELLIGAAGVAGAGALLAACGGGEVGPLTFGARTVDESPTKQLKALVAAYEAKTGNTVTYNATESNAFQNNLSQYLQGTPDDAFQWMAGYRMQFFAEQGLLVDLT